MATSFCKKSCSELNKRDFCSVTPPLSVRWTPGEKEQKSFNLNEDGLIPNHQLQQKHLARPCSNWVAESGVGIRSVSRSNFLHGKMYLINKESLA